MDANEYSDAMYTSYAQQPTCVFFNHQGKTLVQALFTDDESLLISVPVGGRPKVEYGLRKAGWAKNENCMEKTLSGEPENVVGSSADIIVGLMASLNVPIGKVDIDTQKMDWDWN